MKKKWSDSKFWQWTLHAAIGFAWSFAGASIIWLGAGVFVSWLVGFWSSLVSAAMKEGTDQTVYDALQNLDNASAGLHGHAPGKEVCERLGWKGFDWFDFLQHAVGGFFGAWAHIAIWAL